MTDDEAESDAARRAAFSPVLTVDDYRPLSSTVRVECAVLSHRGASRVSNDDHYLVMRLGRQQETLATSLSDADVPAAFEEYAYAMLLADGRGEGGTGSVASRVALGTIARLATQYGKWNMRIDAQTASEMVERAQWLYAGADAAVRSKGRSSQAM